MRNGHVLGGPEGDLAAAREGAELAVLKAVAGRRVAVKAKDGNAGGADLCREGQGIIQAGKLFRQTPYR